MIAYYTCIETLHDILIADRDINTVDLRPLNEVDADKRTIFPVGHIFIGPATFPDGLVQFQVTISVMDIVDVTKKEIREEDQPWKGLDNTQDIKNTMLAVIENFRNQIKKGAAASNGFAIEGELSADPFQARFSNLLTGWTTTFAFQVPNFVQNCP